MNAVAVLHKLGGVKVRFPPAKARFLQQERRRSQFTDVLGCEASFVLSWSTTHVIQSQCSTPLLPLRHGCPGARRGRSCARTSRGPSNGSSSRRTSRRSSRQRWPGGTTAQAAGCVLSDLLLWRLAAKTELVDTSELRRRHVRSWERSGWRHGSEKELPSNSVRPLCAKMLEHACK